MNKVSPHVAAVHCGEGAMRGLAGGMVLGLAAIVLAGAVLAQGPGARPGASPAVVSSDRSTGSAAGDLVVLSHDGQDGRQQITVVDTRQRVIAVYQVDRATGALQLRSVRNVQWDLTIEEYNCASPAPREIRALREQLR
jgi:hypothetical protein